MQSSTLAIIASLGRLAFTAAVVAGAGAVIGLGFVEPAGAAESTPIVADHGYLDWLGWTAYMVIMGFVGHWLASSVLEFMAARAALRDAELDAELAIFMGRIERDCAADEDYANVMAERLEGDTCADYADADRFWRHIDVMAGMTISGEDRPRLAVLFPSLFGGGLR